MYCINYLFQAGVPTSDIVYLYTSIICSVLEYVCPVWHPGLTKKLPKDIECIQKRSLKWLPDKIWTVEIWTVKIWTFKMWNACPTPNAYKRQLNYHLN